MTNLQNPQVPSPGATIEIDAAVYDLQLKLETNLAWLSNAYARAYRHQIIQKDTGRTLYYPEVYTGVANNKPQYHRPTPDNDFSGVCYFVVGKEEQPDFHIHQKNFLNYNIGIIFQANLDLIDKPLLATEDFTQHLIRDVRNVLSNTLYGGGYRLEIQEVCREFNEIWAEFSLDEQNKYLYLPMTGFRFNCRINMREQCPAPVFDRCEAIKQNISIAEGLCLLPEFDFTDPAVFNTLTPQQITDLTAQLCP